MRIECRRWVVATVMALAGLCFIANADARGGRGGGGGARGGRHDRREQDQAASTVNGVHGGLLENERESR